MERTRYSYKPSRTPGGRWIAWLALIFSFSALLISGATFIFCWHGGELAGRAQGLLQGLRKPADGDPAGGGAADSRAPDPAAPWNRLRDKLFRAETLLRNQDGQAPSYLEGLNAELDQLRKDSAEKGGAWISEAADKLKSIREQAAVNGPEAIRRLRQLSGDIQQQVQNMQRAGQALRALTSDGTAHPGETPRPAGRPSEGGQP